MNNEVKEHKKRSSKDTVVIILMVISILYLLNPTAGVFEFIPDRVPIIGNLDEGIAATLLLSCLNYFGYNITGVFKKKRK